MGTFIANVAGCAALGFLVSSPRPDQILWFAATGVSGGLTTMSTFAVEVVTGVSVASLWVVIVYAILSVGAGLTAFSTARSIGSDQPLGRVVAALTGVAVIIGLIAGLANLPQRGLGVALGFIIAAAAGAALRGTLSAGTSFNSRLVAIGIINVVGAFTLSAVSGLADPGLFPRFDGANVGLLTTEAAMNRSLIFGVGALGAFTTFSTAISQIECLARANSARTTMLVGGAMFSAIIAAAALGRLF